MTLLPSLTRLTLTRLRWLFATGDARDAEILALRHQILGCNARLSDRDSTRQTGRSSLFSPQRSVNHVGVSRS